jgi:hypothetical protein
MADPVEREGACHCGTVRFRVRLADRLKSATRCNCSLCRMRGAIAIGVPIADFTLLSGEDALTLYQFNTRVAEHYFCAKCGIYTHHRRRSNPNHYGINAACLKDISPFDFAEVPVVDGVNHPLDRGDKPGGDIVGYLRYQRVSS